MNTKINNKKNSLLQAVLDNNTKQLKQTISSTAHTAEHFLEATYWALQKNYEDCAVLLIPHISSHAGYLNPNHFLQIVATRGNLKLLNLLLPLIDSTKNDNLALSGAAENGHIECVKRLLPVSDPKANNSEALQLAARHGFIDIVTLLLPLSEPAAQENEALLGAIENNRIDIVKLLIPVSDVQDNESLPLQWAVIYNRPEIIKLLIPVSNYTVALHSIKDDPRVLKTVPVFEQCIQDYETNQLKQRLCNALDQDFQAKHTLNKRKI